jgi:hypothetical protein
MPRSPRYTRKMVTARSGLQAAPRLSSSRTRFGGIHGSCIGLVPGKGTGGERPRLMPRPPRYTRKMVTARSGLKAAPRLSSSRTRFGGGHGSCIGLVPGKGTGGERPRMIPRQASPLYPKDGGNGPQRPKSCTSAIVEQNPLRRGSRVLHRSSTRQGHGRGEAANDSQAGLPVIPERW